MTLRALSCLALLALGACDSRTGPRVVEGRYSAYRVNGAAFPAVVLTTPLEVRRVLGASLELTPPDVLTTVLLVQTTFSDGQQTEVAADTLRARYQVGGRELRISELEPYPLAFDPSGTVRSNGTIALTVVRVLPPSVGSGTYRLDLEFRR
jgi:hypothetical protein